MCAPRVITIGHLAATALLVLLPLAADAAQIIVNDAGTALLAGDGRCTLREAMRSANNDTASGPAAGECAAGGGADTIVLAATTQLYTLSVVDAAGTSGSNGLPIVTTLITIEGNGATIQRSGAAGTPEFRLFEVAPGASLTLRFVSLRNGRATNGGAILGVSSTLSLESVEVSSSVATCDGGGLFVFGGSVVFNASEARENTAGCSGGGLFARLAATSMTDSSFIDNVSGAGGGGGVMLFETPVGFVIRTTIDGNTAVLDGGGLLAHGATTRVDIIDSMITNNRSEPRPGDLIGGNGGGIANGRTNNQGAVAPFVAGGIMGIVRSTIANNVAARNPEQSTAPFGGGIANVGQLTIDDSDILQNTAVDGRGGGIWTIDFPGVPSGLTVRDSLVEGNSVGSLGPGGAGGILVAGTATIERSVLRANIGSTGGGFAVRVHPDPAVTGATRIVSSAIVGNSALFGSALNIPPNVTTQTLVESTTISGNLVLGQSDGAAVQVSTSPLKLNGVTLVDNRGGRGGLFANNATVGIHHSIIAANRNGADAFADCSAGVASTWQAAFNLFGEGTGCTLIPGSNLRTVAPQQLFLDVISPLTTETSRPAHVPFSGSVVLDAGDTVVASPGTPDGCPSPDQFGRARPQDDDGDFLAACDLGAVEGPREIFGDGFEG